jgi:3-oxoacyl-[acyl-carrier protein] reductase
MIILTGASGGIGREILPMLSKLDNVIALYNSTPPDIVDNDRVESYKLNLSSEPDVIEFCAGIKKDFKKVTLIHAAALSKDGLAAQLDVNDWDQVMNVNLRGNFLITRELLIPMINEKWGRIIHLSSIAGIRGMPGTLAYSTAKTGLQGMSRVLAREYARFNVTSNILVLGYFNTGLIETLSESVRNAIIKEIPSKKLGNPSNIVNAIEYLIKSEYTNGSVLNIDGAI